LRFFFIAPTLPLAGHSVRAQTVVVREALRALADLGHEVLFQPLLHPDHEGGEPATDVKLLPPLTAPHDAVGSTPSLLLRQAYSNDPGVFYPSHALRDELARRVDSAGADLVFHLWCSAAFAACSRVEAPVFAYAGNPDHYSMAARLKHPDLFGIPRRTVRNRTKLILWRRAYERFEDVHVELVKTSRWVGCVSAPNASYYAERGHPESFYVQNMWPATGERLELPRPTENRIVGNMGGQYATGNTFGLSFLGREILPELDRRLGADYSVHLYGAGALAPAVAGSLAHPRVVNRGFVDDIDGELRSAKVFLLANNANPDFVVGHTRILHAWSVGSCLVAHRNMAVAMPEIVHGENALLGDNAAEIAEHVAHALEDEGLRARIVEGGRHTWERDFLPRTVIRRVVARIEGDEAAG
jgi:hypothetical protein